MACNPDQFSLQFEKLPLGSLHRSRRLRGRALAVYEPSQVFALATIEPREGVREGMKSTKLGASAC
jgi:hypothetical protein